MMYCRLLSLLATVRRPARLASYLACAASLVPTCSVRPSRLTGRTWVRVNAGGLALTLARAREHAYLFRTLATLRTDIVRFESVDDLEWKGPTPAFEPPSPRPS